MRQLVLVFHTFLRIRKTLTALTVRIPSVTTIFGCKLLRISSLSGCSVNFNSGTHSAPSLPFPISRYRCLHWRGWFLFSSLFSQAQGKMSNGFSYSANVSFMGCGHSLITGFVADRRHRSAEQGLA